MFSAFIFIISVAAAYLIGSFPTSFIMAKIMKGIDIRQVGSGNAGATNVLRSVGKIPALVTLVVDIFKGIFVVTALANFFYGFDINFDYDFYRSFLGLTVVCGHIWSVFLKFRGGKGIATTLGVALGLAPILLLPSVFVWIIIFSITKYVSLASIFALITFPVIASIFSRSIYITVLGVVICMISIYKHRTNIERLIKGQENKTVLR
ncbi:MAG: glycerol-3-phosphate 1-O-acyltransferase PlsY [Candidatus Omnitrophota bacterium]|jgi:glycerol-3-phosphate acyltransferase PlsY